MLVINKIFLQFPQKKKDFVRKIKQITIKIDTIN